MERDQARKTGKFCSDPEKYQVSELRALADTESFNYGIPHGKGACHGAIAIHMAILMGSIHLNLIYERRQRSFGVQMAMREKR